MLIKNLSYYLKIFAKKYNYFLKAQNENVLILSNNKLLAFLTQF